MGELTTGTHPIKACDVHFAKGNKKQIVIVLRSSKTHSEADEPQKITIRGKVDANKDFKHCPFQALRIFLQMRGCYYEDDEPLFTYRDGTPVKPFQLLFRRVLKQMIKKIGLDDHLYD